MYLHQIRAAQHNLIRHSVATKLNDRKSQQQMTGVIACHVMETREDSGVGIATFITLSILD